eukprot:gene33722-43580_t
MLKERPLLVNCVTGFVVATIGDFSAQKYSQQFEITEPAIDYVRAVEMGFIRATVITPFIVLWYPLLQKFFPGASAVAVIGRVITDQLIEENFQNKLFTTWITGLQYWPIIHTVNFGFIPSLHQPLFAHVASVYWNAVLSYYAFRTLNTDKG